VSQLKTEIQDKVSHVRGDFRQELILNAWDDVFDVLSLQQDQVAYSIFGGTLTAESGTYVRSVIQSIGEELGVGATTWHIKRTAIGPYALTDVLE
jgi:tRNA U55 pseudouridine synthase TruB